MLDLTTDEVADAEARGVPSSPAMPQQAQRYAMQRKAYRVGGAAVLATRDGALFETAGTLARLIAEGARRRRNLAEWEAAASVLPVEAPGPPAPAHAAEPELPAASAAAPAGHRRTEAAQDTPRRTLADRRRRAATQVRPALEHVRHAALTPTGDVAASGTPL